MSENGLVSRRYYLNPCFINPSRAKFFRGNINTYLHFMSLLHIDVTQVLKILGVKKVLSQPMLKYRWKTPVLGTCVTTENLFIQKQESFHLKAAAICGCFQMKALLALKLLENTEVNILRLSWNDPHFADGIFKSIFLKQNDCISIKISLKFVPYGGMDNK